MTIKQPLISLLLLVLVKLLSAQSKQVYTITADSTKLIGCDSNELIIENHTQNVLGFLYNTGNGRTIFKKPLTKINDTTYLVGTDTLKVGNPNAWVQGGNSFGTIGKIGTKDNKHMDFITNNSQRMRLDSSGALLVGFTANSGNKLDVNGQARIVGVASASSNDSYDIRLFPGYNNGYATGVNASMIAFGTSNIYASIGIIKQTLGNLSDGSLLIGATGPGKVTAITDVAHNPIFVVDGGGSATINGGYTSIGPGGTTGTGSNGNATTFAINGGRGTGTGTVGDILFSTGTAQVSGTTIHAMTNRWWLKGGTGYLSNTSSPTSSVDITGSNGYSQLRMRTTYTPSSSPDTNGNTGDFSWDADYIYVKTASGWKRAALTTF